MYCRVGYEWVFVGKCNRYKVVLEVFSAIYITVFLSLLGNYSIVIILCTNWNYLFASKMSSRFLMKYVILMLIYMPYVKDFFFLLDKGNCRAS